MKEALKTAAEAFALIAALATIYAAVVVVGFAINP
jgi:hypothetical protein